MNTKTNNKDYKLVKLYHYVREKFEDGIRYGCERFGNGKEPRPTDQGIITICPFVMHHQGIFKMNKIHRFAMGHLLDRFPDLGSYQAFHNRGNRISSVMGPLVEALLSGVHPKRALRELWCT